MFKKLHFQKKLFITTAALFLITILIIFLGFSYYIVRVTEAKSKEYFVNTAENSRQRIEKFVDGMQSISLQIVANNTIQNTYMDAIESENASIRYFDIYPEEKRKIRKECASINITSNSVERINIYRKSDIFFSYNWDNLDYNYIQDALKEIEIDQSNWDSQYYYRLTGPHLDIWSEDGGLMISLFRPLIATYSTNEKIAMIEIENSYSKLEKACEISNEGEFELILVDSDTGTVVYPYNALPEEKEKYYIKESYEKEEGVFIRRDLYGKKQLLYKAGVSNSSWQIMVALPYSAHASQAKNVTMLLLLFFLICIIISGFGIYLATIRLSLPIIELRNSLDDITIEKTSISSEFPSNNEIELLKEKFNDVFSALQDSIRKLNISQTAEYEAKIQSLQAQINPHFLYNSLMAISAAGQEVDNIKVQNMCAQLSALFRYSYSNDTISTIGQEINNITTYLEFMKCRYLDELQYQIVVNPMIKETLIPKLSLQPLIENCFTHGFKTVRPPLFIKVFCDVKENGWTIHILDNGGGFSESMLVDLMERIHNVDENFKKNTHAISVDTNNHALLNVYIRLKAMYNDAAFMSVSNMETGGAVVIIKGEIKNEKDRL